MRMKKFLTFLLTLAMVVSMLPATAFAANNTATTMRLAKTQGTVAVTNATGKQVKQTGNMKLYNGYKIKTGAKSYAWISLDNTKAAKLDANSVVSVQKSGQKLTLYLSSGNLFFNVKDPLKSGESFHIKTSTMTTGIRGTSGCVRVINDRVTEVHLLTGQVEIYTENPALHISKTAVLKAGQKATSLIADEAMAAMGEQAGIIIEQLTHEEVCGNCSKEIAADPALVERIRQEAPHLLPEKIAAEADERLAADEKAAEEKQAAIDEKVAQQVFPEEVDPYFEEEESSGGGGGGGGGSAAIDPTAIRNVATWAELLQAIKDYNDGENVQQINLTADIDGSNETESLPEILDQEPLTLYLDQYTLTLNNTLKNNTELTINNAHGFIVGPGADLPVVDNYNTLTVQDATINGNGAYGIQQTAEAAELIVSSDVTFTNCYEAIVGDAGMINLNNPVFENITSYCVSIEEANLNLNGMTVTGNGDFGTLVYNARGTVVVNGNIQAPMDVIYNDTGIVRMTGGTITAGGAAITSNGTLTMTGGTINVATADAYGIVNGGEATLSGGAINVSANGAIGVTSSNSLLMQTGITVTASAGTAVEAHTMVGLAEGATISATGSGRAVVLGGGDAEVYLDRPVKAFIAATAEENVISPLYDEMLLAVTNTGVHVLTDLYGQDDGINTWAEFEAAVTAFNNGTGTSTITLADSINPQASEVSAAVAEMGYLGIGDSTATPLTIDLGSHTLALPVPLSTRTSSPLVITGDSGGDMDGVIKKGDAWITGTALIDNNVTGSKMTGGTMIVSAGIIGVNNTGSFTLAGTATEAAINGSIVVQGGTGVKTTNSFTMEGGIISVESGTGLNVAGNNAILNGGEITAGEDGVAVSNSGTIKMSSNMTVQAASEDGSNVLQMNTGAVMDPSAYMIDEGENGFWFVSITGGGNNAQPEPDPGPEPEPDPDIPTDDDVPTGEIPDDDEPVVDFSAGFVEAILNFTGETATEIMLEGNVTVDNDILSEYGLAGELPITASGTKSLTIDLAGYDLILDVPLVNGGTAAGGIVGIENSGNSGSIKGEADTLISNAATLNLNGVAMEVTGSNGISNSGSLQINNNASIQVNSSSNTAAAIRNSRTLVMNSGTIAATGVTNDRTKVVYAVYDDGGTVNIAGGSITATSGMDASGAALNNAYALYFAGNDVQFSIDAEVAVVRASTSATLWYAAEYQPETFGVMVSEQQSDGYYYLEALDGGGGVSQEATTAFLEQLTKYNAGQQLENNTITLAANVGLDNAVSITGTGANDYLTIDLKGNDLILNETLTNNVTLYITDSVGGGVVKGSAAVLIQNQSESSSVYLEGAAMEVSSGTTGVKGGFISMIGLGIEPAYIETRMPVITVSGQGAVGVDATEFAMSCGEFNVSDYAVGINAAEYSDVRLYYGDFESAPVLIAESGAVAIRTPETLTSEDACPTIAIGDPGYVLATDENCLLTGVYMTVWQDFAIYPYPENAETTEYYSLYPQV